MLTKMINVLHGKLISRNENIELEMEHNILTIEELKKKNALLDKEKQRNEKIIKVLAED